MRISCCHYFMEPASNSGTPAIQRFCCGVGHVIDDILRQLLFSFRLVFFMKVLSLSAANAGWLILQKQLAHVVFSPFCAFLVDSINIPVLSRKLGRRKSWLLIANIVEAVFIPLFFSTCFLCQSDGGQWQRMVYIGVLNTILAFAGTLMNVGHLSIIPVIAKNQSEALEMSAWRTAFSFLSGIITLVVAWAIFGQDNSEHLTAENAMDFTVMSLILVGIGLLFCLIFHIGTKEPSCQINKKLSVTAAGVVVRFEFP
ncbi:major facilitator superfamily domain-containing protein 12-like [Porites lutea]|uniref:major facilitator superfamily domain-containing protein 12-like n=1 Tax=Porites lutea TaxID=51062 RepID=UPI003CC6793B